MDEFQRLCQSSMVADREMHPADKEAECNNSPDNPPLAISAMVLSTPTSLLRQAETSSGLGEPHDSSPGRRSPISRTTPPSGRLACLRRHYQAAGVSESSTELLLSSWRPSTNRHYDSAWNIWEQWCSEHHRDPVFPTICTVVDFLADMFGKGRQYRSLNCYRSALSTVLEPIEGFPVGKHPLVCRLLKGAFQLRPPLPKYSEFWSIDQVLCHIWSWGLNNSLTLQKLTWKLAMLLALCSAGRSSDLSRLSTNNVRYFQSRSVFVPKGLAKQSRSTHLPQEISFTKFSDQHLCPVACVQQYLLVIRILL